MNRLVLFGMPGNELLAARLSVTLNAECGTLATRRFPDGEAYVRLDADVGSADVAIVCTLKDPDPQIPMLLFAAREARALGARGVGLIAPYLAYLRQDKRFRPGEALSSAYFAELLSRYFGWLVTVDPHLHRWHGLNEIYALRSGVVHAAEDLGLWIASNVEQPKLIGPDDESRQWVSEVARIAQAEFIVLDKTRRGDRDVEIVLPRMLGWTGWTPVLVDDIVSSARTMIAVLKEWPRTTARPLCVAVHAVFAPGAYQELLAAEPSRIVTTNSIAHDSNAIDITHRLADAIRPLVAASPG